MIQAESLTRLYGDRVAIEDVSFSVERGEILGFLGPNGAGKTTTMRILTGYMPPTSGQATVAGYDVLTESLEVRKRVGYLPETVPLYPDMTVVQYLEFFAELRRVPDREERVDEVVEMVRMEDRADSFIGNLSKGLRQRVGLAQALLHEPDVLILDEPTIGLDPAQVVEVRNMIRELGKERTVMLSTHILHEAQEVCNRVVIINKGRVVAEDTPEQLQTRLAGGVRVRLRVAGDGTDLADLLARVDCVTAVRTVEDGLMEIETAPGKDARPEVARVVVNGGYNLLELRLVGTSLEDIFLQLTREEQAETEMTQAIEQEVADA